MLIEYQIITDDMKLGMKIVIVGIIAILAQALGVFIL